MKRALLNGTDKVPLRPSPAAAKETTRPIIRSLEHTLIAKAADHEARGLTVSLVRQPLEQVPVEAVYFVKDMRGLVRIDPQEIRFLQADGNYVELHMTNRRMVLRNSLAEVLKMLPSGLMCQVNRAQAVNIRHLDLISHDEVRLCDMVFTLSKNYRSALLASVQIITAR